MDDGDRVGRMSHLVNLNVRPGKTGDLLIDAWCDDIMPKGEPIHIRIAASQKRAD